MARRRPTKARKGGFGAAGFILIILLGALCAGGAVAWLLVTPYGPESATLVEIPPGSSTARIGRDLARAGIIRSQVAFDLVRLWKHGTLKAGTYRFDRPAPPTEVYDRIRRGDVYTIVVTVPEGSTMFEIADRLQQAGFGAPQDFINVAVQESSLIADLDPAAKSLEGYLFPDTYRFAPGTALPEIAATMVRRFRAVASQLGLTVNVHRTVTLASLVEKETALNEERPMVASVFENRLAKNMPLMTDPSVIYGLELENQWRGTLYQSDLKRDTPYNTYLHPGLPPGPVSNPGVRALRAAMNPARTDFLYFVAAGDNPQGRSLFATTIEEHNRNVAGYRHAVKKAGGR
jgi:UPF0755 protein